MIPVLLASPFYWDMKSLEVGPGLVAFLHAIPISEGEYQFALQNGVDELETLLERHDADVCDLAREPTVE